MANESKWDRLKAISSLLASVLIPLVILIGGNSFSQAIKEKEMKLRYVELAVQILQQEPSEDNKEVRNWAIKLINSHSEIPMSEETTKELEKFYLR